MSTCLALAKMVDDMVTKEEKVLHPMAIDTLSDAEWARDPRRRGRHRLRLHRRRAGVAGGATRRGGATAGAAGAPAGPAAPAGLLALNTGGLSLEQLNLVLGVLPIDFQFVDEHDRVRFYSEGRPHLPAQPRA